MTTCRKCKDRPSQTPKESVFQLCEECTTEVYLGKMVPAQRRGAQDIAYATLRKMYGHLKPLVRVELPAC